MDKDHTTKEILCTIGPASCNKRVISRLEDIGVDLFRINLSHTKVENAADVIESISHLTNVPICLDTEGAQVRTGDLKNGSIHIDENSMVRILNKPVWGDRQKFNFYPCDIVGQLKIGDMISIDFNSVLIQVVEVDSEGVMARVLTGGKLGQNKAVTVDREIDMPALTAKDLEILRIGLDKGIKHVALSFANRGADVDYIREIVGMDCFLISKIESLKGVDNLQEIATKSNAILLDRGDLSRQVPIEQIPRAQKDIIYRAKGCGAKVYVATNLLESMISAPTPTRAEVNDIFNTLIDGADGLVLAAETAIGCYPIESAMMVSKVLAQYDEYAHCKSFSADKVRNNNSFLLVEPHGGKIIDVYNQFPHWKKIETYKKLKVDLRTILNVEQIGIGTFSPLRGFMTEVELVSVIADYCLPDGTVWPLPITLQIKEEQAKEYQSSDIIALCYGDNEEVYATIRVEDIYKFDLNIMAQEIFQTTETNHPGVKELMEKGSWFIGGKIELLKRIESSGKHFEITPKQTRKIFENKGWSRIVGFHTRNVVHRVHEHIQMLAFEDYHCDGLFIHPLVGPKKVGDYSAQIILKTYELMMSKYYPKEKVLLAAFQNYPRYSGPREAVFTAICRKNFGCSHFVVGRDHSGVGGYYSPDACHKLFEKLGDIGIKPIFYNAFHYCKICGSYVEKCDHHEDDLLEISGTQGRDMLILETTPPEWFMRKDISNMIIEDMKSGKEVFLR